MEDITLCANHADGCKQAATCYRATAKSGDHQSYASLYSGHDMCAYYLHDWASGEKGEWKGGLAK